MNEKIKELLQNKFNILVDVEILKQVSINNFTYTLVAIECIDYLYMVYGRKRLVHYYIMRPHGLTFVDLEEKIPYEELKYVSDNLLTQLDDLFTNCIDGNKVFYYFENDLDNKIKVKEKFLNVYIQTEKEECWMYNM